MNKQEFIKAVNHVKNWFESFSMLLERIGDSDKDKESIEVNNKIANELSNIEPFLDQLVSSAVEEEKERCAKIVEDNLVNLKTIKVRMTALDAQILTTVNNGYKEIAKSIRESKE